MTNNVILRMAAPPIMNFITWIFHEMVLSPNLYVDRFTEGSENPQKMFHLISRRCSDSF